MAMPQINKLLHRRHERAAKRWLLAAPLIFSFATVLHAQSNDAGPLRTHTGQLQFLRDNREFVATLDQKSFDRFNAATLNHFDEPGSANGAVNRMIVQSETGPVLYDFRRSPPLVQHIAARMTVKRVFWQGEEVVMQGSQGWFRLMRGELTKLQSSRITYH